MKLNNLGRINIRRCRACNQPLIATCDRTKPSILVKVRTGRAEPDREQRRFPTAEIQSDLCFRCRDCTPVCFHKL